MRQLLRFIISVIVLLVVGGDVIAGQVITLRRNLSVSKEPEESASIVLKARTRIEVIESEDGWTLIKFKRAGKIREGFVLDEDLALAQAPVKKVKKEKKAKQLIYVSGIYSIDRQGKREVQTTADTIYDIEEFLGSTTFFEIGINYKFSEEWWTRAGIAKRSVVLEGDAKVRDSNDTASKFRLTQEFLSFQIGAFYKPLDWKKLSMYGFFEMAKGTQSDLEVLSGTQLGETDIETTTHILMIGGFDYELWRKDQFMVGTLLRGGSMVTSDPVVLVFETGIQLGYYF